MDPNVRTAWGGGCTGTLWISGEIYQEMAAAALRCVVLVSSN